MSLTRFSPDFRQSFNLGAVCQRTVLVDRQEFAFLNPLRKQPQRLQSLATMMRDGMKAVKARPLLP
ncbi:hypothetical protein [Dickeya sp. ws52]|uniref:hypothetical protein n=1 Tax=Dickeya sp. ws52 TaxID=2576377 RepID=UPI0003A12407|nr:hypothetical protein [Dickeya sp. ws52]TYL44674.1 hypothetical protein FDP13_01145 [Dickeya sp. ws52]